MRIKSHGTATALWLLLLAVAMVGMFGGILYGQSTLGPLSMGLIAGFSLPLLIGVAIGYFAIRQIFRRLRFGRWELECPEAGGALGEPFQVKLLPPHVVTPEGDLECGLACLKTTFQGGMRSTSPGHRSSASSTSTIWNTTWSFRPETFHPRIGLEMSIPLPNVGLPTQRQRGNSVVWNLSVRVPADRITHDLEFELPINGAVTKPQDAAESLEEEASRRARAEKYRKAMQAAPKTETPTR